MSRKLVIEVDGSQHLDSAADEQRDAALMAAGFRVLRFWNDDVLLRTDQIPEAILSAASPSPPTPLPHAGEGS